MTLDDLKRSWTADVSRQGGMPQLEALQSAITKARRDVRMRDFWMISPLVVVAGGSVFFNWWARDAVNVQSGIAVLAILALAGAVTTVLLYARRTSLRDNPTLRERLEREIETLRRQTALLLTVGYWFLLPTSLTVVISSLAGQHERTGSYSPGFVLWGLYAATLLISALAVWLCRREARRTFLPLSSRLRELHNDLVSPTRKDSPTDSP